MQRSETLVVQSCGKDLTVVEKDASRIKYLAPDEAVDYGLIDRVLYPEELRVQVCTLHAMRLV